MGSTTPREDLKTLRSIIYRMLNTVTGMSYVGQSKRTFYKRYRGRWWNRTDNSYIRRAVRKHGPEAFYVEILEHSVAPERLDEREIHWINHFRSIAPDGYNLHSGGLRHQMSPPLRRKTAKIQRDAQRRSYALVKGDREYTFTSIAAFASQHKLHKGMVGRVLKGTSKAHRGYHLPGVDTRLRCKTHRVRHLVKDGVVYEVHTIRAFAKEHGLRSDVVSQLFAGVTRIHRGFHIPDLPPLAARKPMRTLVQATLTHETTGETLVVPDVHRSEFVQQTGIDLYALLCRRCKVSKGYRLSEVAR